MAAYSVLLVPMLFFAVAWFAAKLNRGEGLNPATLDALSFAAAGAASAVALFLGG